MDIEEKSGGAYIYFVGISSKSADLKSAKSESINDATTQLVDYIGVRATTKFQSRKEMADLDNISSFKEDIIQTIEGKGSANVAVDLEDVYYEQYSDNTIIMYSLIKFPQSWIDKERNRLQKLVSDQRSTSTQYLTEADAAIKNGELAKALDLSLGALIISEKAAENSDLYDESRNIITLILSSITFSLESSSRYAFIEGGSDPILVKTSSSKIGKGVPGFTLLITENNSNANIITKSGNISDDQGLVNFTADRILRSDTDKLSITVTFSADKFDNIMKFDEDFYSQILKFQKSQALQVNLTVVNHDKVIPTGIGIIDILYDDKKEQKREFIPQFQETVSGKFAERGYNIISIELPDNSSIQGMNEDQIKALILKNMKVKSPQVKRFLLGIREINVLGQIGKDITFQSYDVNASDIVIVDMKLILSMIDVETNNVVKGLTISVKGQGLNIAQAISTAEKRLLEKLNEEMQTYN